MCPSGVDERHRAQVEAYVHNVNARVRRKGNKATRESAHCDITGKLASRSMLSIDTVQIDEQDDEGHERFVVSLAFDEAAWNKRRSTDGFVLLLPHADLPHSAAELVARDQRQGRGREGLSDHQEQPWATPRLSSHRPEGRDSCCLRPGVANMG